MTGKGTATPSLAGQSVALLVGRGGGLIFSFAIPLVLVRVLDQSLFGQYKQYFLIATTVVQVVPLGLPASLYFFVPGGGTRRGRYIVSAVSVLALTGFGVFVLLTFLGSAISNWLHAPALGRVMPLLGLYVLLTLVSSFAEELAVIEQRRKTAGLVVFSSEALRACLLVGATLWWGTLTAIAWASIGYGIVRIGYLFAFVFHVYGFNHVRFTLEDVSRQLGYALPFGLAVIVQTAHSALHMYFVAGATDPVTFAIYAVGCFQIPMTHMVYAAIGDVALVRTTQYYKSGRQDASLELYRVATKVLSGLFIPTYVFVATFAAVIVEVLFTSEYLAAVPILIIFSISLLLVPGDHIVLRAYAETRFILRANVLGLVIQSVLLVPLYAVLGPVGAGVAFVTGLGVVRLAGVLRISKVLDQSPRSLLPLKPMSVVAASAIVSGAVASVVTGSLSASARLLLGAITFGAVFVLLVWRLDVLTPDDKSRIKRAGSVLASYRRHF